MFSWFPSLMRGTLVTIQLGISFFIFGFFIGVLTALGQVYGNKVLSYFCTGFAWVFRSLPAIVILYLFYFGFDMSPFLAALLGLGLRTGAYQSQFMRGAIQSITGGQMVAARSLGMSKLRAIRKIILPQMLRLSLPYLSNEYAITIKDTSLAFAIGVVEVLKEGRLIITRLHNPMEIFLIIAVIYLIITRLGTKAIQLIEDRYRLPGFEVGQ